MLLVGGHLHPQKSPTKTNTKLYTELDTLLTGFSLSSKAFINQSVSAEAARGRQQPALPSLLCSITSERLLHSCLYSLGHFPVTKRRDRSTLQLFLQTLPEPHGRPWVRSRTRCRGLAPVSPRLEPGITPRRVGDQFKSGTELFPPLHLAAAPKPHSCSGFWLSWSARVEARPSPVPAALRGPSSRREAQREPGPGWG